MSEVKNDSYQFVAEKNFLFSYIRGLAYILL